MKVLLLGGTGAMGMHLKDILAERGEDVYITSRSSRIDSPNINYIRGNAHDLAFLSPLLENKWDAIVDFMVYSTEEFGSRVGLLLDSTKQYVFLSSARVFSNVETPINESSPRLLDCCEDEEFLSTDEYSLKKAREEDLLTKSGRANYTIVRPYITYSEKRLQLGDMEHQDWIPRALDGRAIVFSDDIKNHMTTLTYGHDMARGIASIIGNKESMGETFNITCGKSISWIEVLDIYLDAIEDCTGTRPKVKWIQQSLKLKKNKLKYQVIYDRSFDRVFDNSKITNLVPTLSFVDPHVGLKQCIKAYIDSKEPMSFSGLKEGMRDRITGDRMRLNRFCSAREKILYILSRYFYFDKVINNNQ